MSKKFNNMQRNGKVLDEPTRTIQINITLSEQENAEVEAQRQIEVERLGVGASLPRAVFIRMLVLSGIKSRRDEHEAIMSGLSQRPR